MTKKFDLVIQEALPSFFVLGTQKAGTTSLHDWLVQQPDVSLPIMKETHFFAQDEKYARGIEWYINQFPNINENLIIGEIGPEYMYSEQAPFRIREWIHAPNFIFIFRHPIERAYSNYLMESRMGYEQLSFYQALVEEPRRLADGNWEKRAHYSYIARGRYTQQVDKYKQIFPESKYLYIKFDDLIADGVTGYAAYKRICEFIGLKSSPDIADRSKRRNPASMPYSRFIENFLYGKSVIKNVLGILLPNKDLKEKIAFRLDAINQRQMQKKPIGKVPESVIEQTKQEIMLLQKMSGLDLSDWNRRTDNIVRLNNLRRAS